MFIARDKDGTLNVFKMKPRRMLGDGKNGKPMHSKDSHDYWEMETPWYDENDDYNASDFFELDGTLFTELEWEDEPIEVSVVCSTERTDGYVARDQDTGELTLFRMLPVRRSMGWPNKDGSLKTVMKFWDAPESRPLLNDYFKIDGGFDELTWENEPMSVQFMKVAMEREKQDKKKTIDS